MHPMVYEDLVERYNRLVVETVPKMEREVEEGVKREWRLKGEIGELGRVIECKVIEIVKLN